MGITWLASYPKSGNTWLRILLSNYWQNSDTPVAMNELLGKPVTLDRLVFDETLGLQSENLLLDELDIYQPLFQGLLSEECSNPCFIKTHESYRKNKNGEPIFASDCTDGVIYIVRNPLDIAISFANHEGKSFDEIIAVMANEEFTLSPIGSHLYSQLPEKIGSWSSHVSSWITAQNVNVCLIHYEDLHTHPQTTLEKILRFIDWPIDQERIHKTLEFSRFKNCKSNENLAGFREKPPNVKNFFRSGNVGDGLKQLQKNQVKQLIASHGALMQKLSYNVP